ncbi:alpha-L-fucosidase [Tessaracoccus defluvii]|uniref:alpha-L-fucosidase n=1 Tax=Tessaracoccus defluvii TaxID=1285901 RepID=A0A7H0H6I8_9ACTN|nr:alpha-L-fucosidase [Tessaracoccus defluvii]QNP56154.1 alpha-L-fucosidase [Tessaracoccus defluvii]
MTKKTWPDLARPTPEWFARAKFGIFIHWGPYSVPAWGEPIGPLGEIDEATWFAHNPYSEWYLNTIRIPGSPAQQHHREVYGDAPYDDFLDQWRAEKFDPEDWARLFARAGAEYVVPTTKHHDGVTLWDAPGTGTRNTVQRGPERDLIGAIAQAVRSNGMRFGVYYSGGLDWSISDFPPHTTDEEVTSLRPNDAAYHFYAAAHVRDLIERYQPDVLWNDIEWPDGGKHTAPGGLHELFAAYYAANPDGVVNDRWGHTHHDFATTEYSAFSDNEKEPVWENNRGLGFSFAYNRNESTDEILSTMQLAKHWVGVVGKGGRLLINVGPTAEGIIPDLQRQTLEGFGDWKAPLAETAASVVERTPQLDAGEGWRGDWLTPAERIVFVDEPREVRVTGDGLDLTQVRVLSGDVCTEFVDDELVVRVNATNGGPAAVAIARR